NQAAAPLWQWVLAAVILSVVLWGVVWLFSSTAGSSEPGPGLTDTAILAAIKGSDDLELEARSLIQASRLFLSAGGTLADLAHHGGWVRSQSHKPRIVYFTYRHPGVHASDRFYFDLRTGKLFQ